MYFILVFYKIFAMNRAYFPLNRIKSLAYFCNWDTTFLQWCKSWVFKHFRRASTLYQFVIFDHASVCPHRATGLSFIFGNYTKICLRVPIVLEVGQKTQMLHLSHGSYPSGFTFFCMIGRYKDHDPCFVWSTSSDLTNNWECNISLFKTMSLIVITRKYF